MSDTQQQQEPGFSVSGFSSGRIESQVMFHLTFAHSAAKASRDRDSPSTFTRCLSHAKAALNLARQADRPDLQEKAQLATVDFLEIVGRRREAMEARIIAAAMVDDLQLELEPLSGTNEDGPRLISVGGVPIDEVIRLLGDDKTKQHLASFSQRQSSAAADTSGVHETDTTATCDPGSQEDLLPKVAFEGRQIRDVQGRLATVLTDAPKLRRKPKFQD